ncbi:MAG: hypothetical protein KatS3mg032_0319 [Cyclobacteriaceae bacterium]|nr:MAG: hypothetical protein KatS3mg032_0319 [Cyclobacteriaceae bacterium]
MNKDRLQQLKDFLAEEPDNAFLHYAIALEYRRSQPDVAERMMDEVIAKFGDYLPALHTAALWKWEDGKHTEAALLLKRGIALAGEKGDASALRELRSAWQELTGEVWEEN